MDHEFWQQRWREGRTGFHRNEVMPLLEKHWAALALLRGSRVLVPLCGKSLDLLWLASQGHRVLGVELSDLAVMQFFSANGLTPQVHESRYGVHYRADAIELICGDAFALDATVLADCAGVYDRAAMIALPEDLRQRYFQTVYQQLPQGCRGLLITLEYPQEEMAGPPFPVYEEELQERGSPDWEIDCLERRDILADEPGFLVSSLHTAVYRLTRTQ